MKDLKERLKNKSLNIKELEKYGFIKDNDKYVFQRYISDNQFKMVVIFEKKKAFSKLIDLSIDEEYPLVDVEDASGEFVGKLREEYENILDDIFEKCTYIDSFKSSQSKQIIEYIYQKYGDELEFLWEKFDDTAIWRNKKNQKWYGLLMQISKSKLGLKSEEKVEVIDLRYQKEEIENIVDGKTIFPGYHMNKKSWITIVMDESISIDNVKELVDNSYELSVGTKSGKTMNILMSKMLDYLTTIPKGKVVTYQQVAMFLGDKKLARVVGNMLHKNPDGDKYPCYKVVNSQGKLSDAFVFGGINIQKERLEKDGIEVKDGKVDLNIYQWK